MDKIPGFGWETKSAHATNIYKNFSKARYLENASKIVGYIPIIGNLVGIGRLFSFAWQKGRRSQDIYNIPRGIIEATGFGVILLPVDAIITSVRNSKAKEISVPKTKELSVPLSNKNSDFENLVDVPTLLTIFENKEHLKKADPYNTNSDSYDKHAVYNFLNGITDLEKTPTEIGVDPEDYDTYFEELMEIDHGHALKVDFQGRGKMGPAKISEKNPTPWKTRHTDISSLPPEIQEYIKYVGAVDPRYLSREEEDQMTLNEDKMANELQSDSDKKLFRAAIQEALDANGYYRGFIHFAKDSSVNTPKERIYIQMNPLRAKDLVEIVLKEVYNNPGVMDVKIAGPMFAGRIDGIVIYVGGDDAQNELNKIVEFLMQKQKEEPDLFGDSIIPLKRQHAPGIASAPSPRGGESYTTIMAEAVATSLATAKDPEDLKEKVLDYLNANLKV